MWKATVRPHGLNTPNFPDAVQPVNDALRANMLEGASLAAVSPQLLIIAAWGVLTFFAALKLFRWR